MIVSRLTSGKDLKKGIEEIIVQNDLNSGIILCIVGSLNSALLRMSNEDVKEFRGPFEIVSAEGTITRDGIHVHISMSDGRGRVFGGHLLDGCIINTTAEICIMEIEGTLRRIFDPETGYKELSID
ncbi:MAG: DNA-binding protein [Euryarchaeota archaeon]|nr:DNA-binding protein [Euryarchaeota archaeon]